MPFSDIDLDAAQAALFARDMRAVARADGDVHPRELALIASFEAELPEGTAPAASLGGPALHDAYLRSLALVALADGKVSDAEREAIVRLSGAQGIDAPTIEAALLDARRLLLGQLAGVRVFRDEVRDIAGELGLPPDEVDRLGGE